MKNVFFGMVLAGAFVFAACEEKTAPPTPANAATNAAKAAGAPTTPAAAAAATNAAK